MGSDAGGERIPRFLALLLALMAAIALIPSLANAQKAAKKLTKQDVIDLLTGDVPSDQVAQEARKSGISFQVTASVAKEIHDVGGTDELIRVLRTLASRATPPPVPTPRPVPPTSPPVLMIETSPGSQVYVDDEPVGSTSQQGHLKLTRLAAGDHRVRISLSGYQDHEETVSLTAGQVTTLAATLQRTEAPLPPPPQPEPPPNPGKAGYLGIIPMDKQPEGARGVVISGAQPGGPADKAGLKTYDTILAVDGRQVTTPTDLRAALANHQVGEAVQITWYNGSTTVTRQIRLATLPVQGQNTTQLKGFATFRVAHDHGRSGQDYCVGVMAIGKGMIYYKSDNGVHNFEIPLNSIREVRRNAVYLVGYGAFHIHTITGAKYNFVALGQKDLPQAPDQILMAITNAMAK